MKSEVNYVLSVKEYVEVPPSHYKLPRNTEHSAFFFSYFYWGQSAKILQHRQKERFKISVANLTPQNHEIFTVLCMVGCKFLPPTMKTSVKLCEYVKLYSQSVLF